MSIVFTSFVNKSPLIHCLIVWYPSHFYTSFPRSCYSPFFYQQPTEAFHSTVYLQILCILHQTSIPVFSARGHTTDRRGQCSLLDVPVVARSARLHFLNREKTASPMSSLSMVFMSVIHRISLNIRVPEKTKPKAVHRNPSSMRVPKRQPLNANAPACCFEDAVDRSQECVLRFRLRPSPHW